MRNDKTKSVLGIIGGSGVYEPVCHRLGEHIAVAAPEAGIEAARGGTYLVMEGPQFSSLAESELYRTWNCDVIGMTNMPEAKLAREAEICYATVAMVTDYDCWHPNHDDVTVDVIVQVLRANADNACSLVKKISPRIRADQIESCFVIDLPDVGGRARLEKQGQKVFSLCEFEGD